VTQSKRALRLNPASLALVVAWQRAAGSHEVCALCAVDHAGRQRLLQLTNHAELTGAFEVSRSDSDAVRAAATRLGLKIVAFVHTHPHHGPDMSPRDAQSFDRDTLPWIIVGDVATLPRQRAYARPLADVVVH